MNIRKANNYDSFAVYALHISSIVYFCSDFYSKESISAWVNSKSIEAYKNLDDHKILIVAEEDAEIVGFGLLNVYEKRIDSLYVSPQYARKGYGKALLEKLEIIAQKKGLDELTLSSTLNAITFYHHMGYEGDVKSTYKLLSGVKLDCIFMSKKLSPIPLN